jgi:hypothetical protein
MADRKQHVAGQFMEEQAFWDAYVRIRRELGIDYTTRHSFPAGYTDLSS